MNERIPSSINTYKQAIIANNSASFDECFTEDAIVTDAGKTYTGIRAIKNWGDELGKMNLKTEVTDLTVDNNTAIIKTHVSGDFERSPLSFSYKIVLEKGKINKLDIEVVE